MTPDTKPSSGAPTAPRRRFPDAFALLVGCVLLAALASFVLPPGQYDRRDDLATGRRLVVAGTFHAVERHPVGPFAALVAIPKGLLDAGPIVFLIFLVGGAFAVIERTGVLGRGVGLLERALAGREMLAIPACALLFALGGIFEGMLEEIIALVPVLLLLARRVRLDPLTAVAMSMGAALVGGAFSPANPFQVGIAQKLAQLPLLSGAGFRIVVLVIALAAFIAWTMRHAARHRPTALPAEGPAGGAMSWRDAAVLVLVPLAFAVYVFGVLRLGWDFDQMSALFFAMGIGAGLLGGLGIEGTIEAYKHGFKDMAWAAIVVGFSRAIYVVLDQGHVIDTIVHALVTPIAGLPPALSGLGMMAAHTAIHFPVPSMTGHAVLTIPILVPVSDLVGVSRQVTVLAFQYGAGLAEMLTPTNGAMMAILAAAGVGYDRWLRFMLPIYGILVALGALAIVAAVALRLA
ncbi:MAG: YfcC family protein [Acidobacteriota bacterium]